MFDKLQNIYANNEGLRPYQILNKNGINDMKPQETGRCPYCGSEDVEEYYDGTAEPTNEARPNIRYFL